jgi:simple sugar transport system ATP-binding protein
LQRVILARETSASRSLWRRCSRRGLDVEAIEGVHRLLLAQREAAILLISEELEELFSLSDRILVIYEGRIMGEITGELDTPVNVEAIGLMMTGQRIESGLVDEVSG